MSLSGFFSGGDRGNERRTRFNGPRSGSVEGMEVGEKPQVKRIVNVESKGIDVTAKVGSSELQFSKGTISSEKIVQILNDKKEARSRSRSNSGNRKEDVEENEVMKKVDVNLKAGFEITGNFSHDVGDLTVKMANHLGHYLSEIGAVAKWTMYDPKESELLLHREFQKNVRELLSTPNLKHQGLALLDEFSSAEDLLAEGVDKYVEAVHSVLQTDLDESIAVLIDCLSYKLSSPVIDTSTGYDTVSRQLFRLLCGPCAVAARALKNICNSEPPIEFNEKTLLNNITAVIDPGKLTLVIGPPGCGKTTFLKAISGKLYKSSVGNQLSFGNVLEGELRYNGRNVKDLQNLAAWVSYTGQDDEHQSLLTVKETLQFAFKCRKEAMYSDPQILGLVEQFSGREAVEKLLMLKQLDVEIAMALLGLTTCKDTVIGNENLKGVSGGERRRVTLGEMLVTGSQIMCCDEISTGLDSAATFDIMAYLRSAAHVLRKSIVVALLQPPPEVINLFDDIIILSEGSLIYHGSAENVVGYFNSIGFKMIEGKDIGDFMVEIPTRNGRDYLMNAQELGERGIDYEDIPKTAQEFSVAWQNSDLFQRELVNLASRKREYMTGTTATNYFDYDDMPVRSFWKGLWDTICWSMDLRLRDKVQITARIIANCLTGFFFGTLFWQLTLSDWWLKGMLFLMALMFIVSCSFPSVQVFSKQKGIFFKQVEAKFYSPLQFSLGQYIVAIPFIAFDTAVFGASMYWMCGLAPEIYPFLVFIAVCVSYGVAVNSVMQVFPFVTRNEDSAIVAAALYLILSIAASSALSTESMTPYFFRWTIWINPLAWSYRALAINEYMTKGYQHSPCKFNMIGTNITIFRNCSDYFLEVREVRKDPNYVWGGIVFNVIVSITMLAIQTYAIGHVRFEQLKVGVFPGMDGETGKKATAQQKTDASRNYLEQMYLSAVSPKSGKRSLRSNMLETLQAATAVNIDIKNYNENDLNQPLLGNDSSSTSNFDGDALSSLPEIDKKTLVVKNLWYTIPIQGEPIDFLKDVSFIARPYRLMGLMGSSGAGKTTLMDVISGRKTVGYARGDIIVNGEIKDKTNQADFVKYAAYVEQFGVHAGAATIRESLQFSADLRLSFQTFQLQHPNVKVTWKDFKDMKRNLVSNILKVLELEEISNDITGLLSMEQNKRLTLGVELVANPSVIFCDEPTSGLDARAAAIVMKVLWKTAKLGRTVICTVHQPSTAIFNFFDDLILLKRGGEIVFAGELGDKSKNLIKYFNSIPGTKPYEPGMNPATWMLEVIGAGTDMRANSNIEYSNYYKNSVLFKENTEELNALLRSYSAKLGKRLEYGRRNVNVLASPLVSPFHFAHESGNHLGNKDNAWWNGRNGYTRSQLTQTIFLLDRNLKTYWRSPEFSLNRLLVVLIFTVIFSIFFYHSELNAVTDIEGRIVNIFFFSILTCIYNLYTLVPFALSRRALFYRERAQGMYSVLSFSIAEGLVEVPWIFVQVTMTLPFLYYLTNLSTVTTFPFFYFFAMMIFSLNLMTSLGLLAASLFPDPLAAQLSAVFVVIVLMVFCGIMVPLDRLPLPYVPIYYISFFKYIAEGLMSTQFHNIDQNICLPAGMPWNESNPKVLVETMTWLHDHVSKDFPENICTQDGTLTIDFFDLKKTIASVKNVTGVVIESEEFVLGHFMKDYDYENRWLDLYVVLGWVLGLRFLAFLVMANVNHQKR